MPGYSFEDFWRRFFPEGRLMARDEALRRAQRVNPDELTSPLPDEAMVAYQDAVAEVYGAYEDFRFQAATLARLLERVSFPRETLVSLGSGPGSYELWLVSQEKVGTAILIDHSRAMLDRAAGIARELGVEEQVEYIQADATRSGLADERADLVISINALHWSKNWQRWIREVNRLAKDNAAVFLACSLGAPRSGISDEALLREVWRQCVVEQNGFLLPPQFTPAGIAQSTRYWVAGRRKMRKQPSAKRL